MLSKWTWVSAITSNWPLMTTAFIWNFHIEFTLHILLWGIPFNLLSAEVQPNVTLVIFLDLVLHPCSAHRPPVNCHLPLLWFSHCNFLSVGTPAPGVPVVRTVNCIWCTSSPDHCTSVHIGKKPVLQCTILRTVHQYTPSISNPLFTVYIGHIKPVYWSEDET